MVKKSKNPFLFFFFIFLSTQTPPFGTSSNVIALTTTPRLVAAEIKFGDSCLLTLLKSLQLFAAL
jgi:hypothetical protein